MGDHKAPPSHCHAKKAPDGTVGNAEFASHCCRAAACATEADPGSSKILHRAGQVRRTVAVQSQSPFPIKRPPALRARSATTAKRIPTGVRLGAAILFLGLAACTTSRSAREKFLERVPPPQPLLNASATYGAGVLTVQAWLGPSVRLRKPGEHPEAAGEAGGGEGRRGRFRGSSRENDSISGLAAPFEEDGANESEYSQAEIDEMYGRVNYQYVLPPRLALTLTFANPGSKLIMISVVEVSSGLGNFAPRPEQLTLGPGQQGSLDPMLSNLDNNFDELDVTLTVKIGDRRETQVLKLRKVQEPPPAAPGR
jgi:hypothetical protein